METFKCIETRRSIRKFTDEAVSRELVEKIVAAASMSPSWKNTQTVRYVAVADREKISYIGENCVMGFTWNGKVLSSAALVIALLTVTGRSGFEKDGSFSTSQGTHWQSFDAGIAAQSFSLAAHDLGLGSVIIGVYDQELVKAALEIPEGHQVSALIALGYPAEQPKTPPRKTVDELLTWK